MRTKLPIPNNATDATLPIWNSEVLWTQYLLRISPYHLSTLHNNNIMLLMNEYHSDLCVSVCTYVCMRSCTRVRMYVCTCMHACVYVYACMCVSIHLLYTHIRTYVSTQLTEKYYTTITLTKHSNSEEVPQVHPISQLTTG